MGAAAGEVEIVVGTTVPVSVCGPWGGQAPVSQHMKSERRGTRKETASHRGYCVSELVIQQVLCIRY